MKATLIVASRLVALTALYVICFAAVSAALLGHGGTGHPHDERSVVGWLLVLVLRGRRQ